MLRIVDFLCYQRGKGEQVADKERPPERQEKEGKNETEQGYKCARLIVQEFVLRYGDYPRPYLFEKFFHINLLC